MSDQSTIGRPMEILLVEDGLVDARLTIGALQHGGFRHRLTLVRDGEEALEFVFQRGKFALAPRPDLILLDLMLPKRSGLEVLHEVKVSRGTQGDPGGRDDGVGCGRRQVAMRFSSGRWLHHQAGQLGEIPGPRTDAQEVLAG